MGQRSVTEWVAVTVVLGAVLCGLGWWVTPRTVAPEAARRPAPAPPALEAPPPPREAPPPPDTGTTEVECNLTQSVGHVQLVEVRGDEVLGPVAVTGLRDWIRFRPRRPAGVGWVYVEGFEPTPIAWIEGSCLEQIDLQEVPQGRIVPTIDGLLAPGVDYTLAGGRYRAVYLTADDELVPLDVPAGVPVEVTMTASFGVHMVAGDAVEVQVTAGEDTPVTVPPPALPPLGWSLQAVTDGWKVAWVLPDAPIAGELETGDVIVRVDDVPVEELVLSEVLWEDEPLPVHVLPYGESHTLEVVVRPSRRYATP